MNFDALHTYLTHELLNEPSAQVAPDDDLLLSGRLDSLGVTRMVAHLEETLSVDIPPEDVTLEHFGTLRQIEAYIATRKPS